MDDANFDALIRSFGAAQSRRCLARLLSGLTIGGVLTALGVRPVAAGSRIGGTPCTKDSQCLTGTCAGRKGERRCTCTKKLPFCKQPQNPCRKAVCDEARERCVTRNRRGSCPGDGNLCTKDVCDEGTCTHPAKLNDTPCGDDRKCSGGVCAEEPSCKGPGFPCDPSFDEICCSGTCYTYPNSTTSICTCSKRGRPCHNTDEDQCCQSSPGVEVPCIGFYCGGCRGKDQPCDENGGGCCEGLTCQDGHCQELVIG